MSAGLALQFRQMGYPSVFALKGGWDGWVAAGYPIEKKSVQHAPPAPVKESEKILKELQNPVQ